MGYGTRKPASNEPHKKNKFPYGADGYIDDTTLILSGCGRRCEKCQRATWNKYLKEDLCPICRGEEVQP
jgi:hypothetical protein